jgi:glutaredoxin
MALLLASLLTKRGKEEAVLGGILFVATVYVMYFLYGLGILTFLTTSGFMEVLRVVVPALVLLLALWELKSFFFYTPGFVSLEMPMFLRPLAKRAIAAAESPLSAVPVAALCSLLLLPCSSGPYFTALPLMEGAVDLILYNLIFVLPMVLIVAAVAVGVSPEMIKNLRDKHTRAIHLVSGLLLLLVFFYLTPVGTTAAHGTASGGGSAGGCKTTVLVVTDPHCPHCQHLKETLAELGICYKEIPREEAKELAEERGVVWDGGVPLLIYEDTVIYGFPAKYQEENGRFRDEEKMCEAIGSPVYENGEYAYCILNNGAILGNRRVLERFVLGR